MTAPTGLRRFRAHWFAWHHGTVTDPRNSIVARRAAASVADVLAVRACLLEHASASAERGTVGGFEADVCDALLGLPDGRTAAILTALAERGLVRDGRLTGWEEAQAVRDAATGVHRQRRARDRKRTSRDVTDSHVTSAHRTGQDRTEQNSLLQPSSPSSSYQLSESSERSSERTIASDRGRPEQIAPSAPASIARTPTSPEAKQAADRAALAEQRRAELLKLERDFVGAGFRTALGHETPNSYRTAFRTWREEQRVRGIRIADGAQRAT